MDGLGELLKQPSLAADLAGRMTAPDHRVLLRGPSGSGKTTVADLTASLLEPKGVVIRISGDATNASTRYLAMNRAIARFRMSKAARETAQSIFVAPMRAIPYVGGVVSELARIAITARATRGPDFLNTEQRDLLNGLNGVAELNRVFLIVDDLGWLDSDTAQLLLTLAHPEVQEGYPFVNQLSALFIETSDVTPSLPAPLLDQLRPADVVNCPPIERPQFGQVLALLGLRRRLDPELADGLYAISRGHLQIAKQIVKLDQGEDLSSLLARGDATSLMSNLLDLRLRRLNGGETFPLFLSVAACIGSVFSEAEVRCALMDPASFTALLQLARNEELMSKDGEALTFAHDLIRAAAEHLATPHAADLHARLAECVKKLRPGDYAARLRHTRLSSDPTGVSELAFAVAMQRVRGEGDVQSAVASEVGELAPVLDDAREAYRLMDAGKHDEAIRLMVPRYDGGDGIVQGEIVALLALNHIKRRTLDAYNHAIALLEHWKERREEPETWQRLMSVLVTALAFVGESERATQSYAVLASELTRTARSDPGARTRLEALNRKADMFLASEIAVKHLERARVWFGPPAGSDVPRHAFEYTSCLVNLSGSLFTFGRFAEAATHAEEAVRSADRLREKGLRTVEPYKALNNFVIAAYRTGQEDPGALGAALELLISGPVAETLRDRSLVACNRGALALLEGRTQDGLEILEKVWQHVVAAELDSYYRLYVGSNTAVALALSGRHEDAAALMRAVDRDVGTMPKWLRQAYRRRHEMMSSVLAAPTSMDARTIDGYLTSLRATDGDQDPWWSIGRGLLLSDIQVWSEG